jgi:hypothetical protein
MVLLQPHVGWRTWRWIHCRIKRGFFAHPRIGVKRRGECWWRYHIAFIVDDCRRLDQVFQVDTRTNAKDANDLHTLWIASRQGLPPSCLPLGNNQSVPLSVG